ncbi:hypothetical protein [Enterococcus avium]|uniref:hypothetical protein n=1 Tax=Enterococcus avium TaxID=33945 RepID=UPI003390BBF1
MKITIDLYDSSEPVQCFSLHPQCSKKEFINLKKIAKKYFYMEIRGDYVWDADYLKESILFRLYRKVKREKPKYGIDFEGFLTSLDISESLLAYCLLELSLKNDEKETFKKMCKMFIRRG